MGGSASKASRKLPTKAQPAWAGARTAQPLPEQFRMSKPEALASETKGSRKLLFSQFGVYNEMMFRVSDRD
jgi:hypothetical protein